jgi:hypothetical protein
MRTPLSISLLLVALLGCSRSTAPVITTPNATQIAEFTANAKITLLASAQPVGWREERGMDAALWLQLRMPKTELQSFLDGSPFRSATLNTNDQSLVFKFRDFFPTPPVHYRCAEQALPNARFLNILIIDESDTTNALVSLMWHET